MDVYQHVRALVDRHQSSRRRSVVFRAMVGVTTSMPSFPWLITTAAPRRRRQGRTGSIRGLARAIVATERGRIFVYPSPATRVPIGCSRRRDMGGATRPALVASDTASSWLETFIFWRIPRMRARIA